MHIQHIHTVTYSTRSIASKACILNEMIIYKAFSVLCLTEPNRTECFELTK